MRAGAVWAAVAASVGVGGCAAEALPGHAFAVEAFGTADTCNRPAVAFEDAFDLRLTDTGGEVALYVANSLFARGEISGCRVDYRTTTWTDVRDTGDLRWRMVGTALVDFGGEGCGLPSGVDWQGTESYEIIGSDDPGIAAGCTYEVELIGTWTGEVEAPPPDAE